MREKSKAVEDKVAELMESYEASRTSWDKEVEEEVLWETAVWQYMDTVSVRRINVEKGEMQWIHVI